MAKYLENLLRDSTLPFISIAKKFLSLTGLIMLKIPNETFLRINQYLWHAWHTNFFLNSGLDHFQQREYLASEQGSSGSRPMGLLEPILKSSARSQG